MSWREQICQSRAMRWRDAHKGAALLPEKLYFSFSFDHIGLDSGDQGNPRYRSCISSPSISKQPLLLIESSTYCPSSGVYIMEKASVSKKPKSSSGSKRSEESQGSSSKPKHKQVQRLTSQALEETSGSGDVGSSTRPVGGSNVLRDFDIPIRRRAPSNNSLPEGLEWSSQKSGEGGSARVSRHEKARSGIRGSRFERPQLGSLRMGSSQVLYSESELADKPSQMSRADSLASSIDSEAHLRANRAYSPTGSEQRLNGEPPIFRDTSPGQDFGDYCDPGEALDVEKPAALSHARTLMIHDWIDHHDFTEHKQVHQTHRLVNWKQFKLPEKLLAYDYAKWRAR